MKYIYFFGDGKADGNVKMKEELGGKGANLADMSCIGVPVPPGFTIITDVCDYYYKNNKTLPATLSAELDEHIARLEKSKGAKFGDPTSPLLVSVRSGAVVSMPGMMNTILNLGINDEVCAGLAKKTNNEKMALDSYRRFINMFGDVVVGIAHDKFEHEYTTIKAKYGVKEDTDLSVEGLKEVVEAYKKVYRENASAEDAPVQKAAGVDFPTDAREQLDMAIIAVICSWMSSRAVFYRAKEKFFGLKGTAINIQAMVFGNMGKTSGTGVAFTRDSADGTNVFYGEYLIDAQGEDVVAGIRTPLPIAEMEKEWPVIYKELDDIRHKLEKHYREMQDVEFTIEEGKLYMLQTRTGKRTGMAAVKIAYDMVKEGLINEEEALMRVSGDHLNQLLFDVLDPAEKQKAIDGGRMFAKGLSAGPGAASGHIVFTADDVIAWKKDGKKTILVRHETSPEDVIGMADSEATVTSTGGMTSHAAVVARSWGKCCVVGASELSIDYASNSMKVGNQTIKQGEYISVDGSTGELIMGEVKKTKSPVIAGLVDKDPKAMENDEYKMFVSIMEWAEKTKKLTVRANADSPNDSRVARELGAQGIGLCRTEHMFFEGDRIWDMRTMIFAENAEDRKVALAKLLPYQREDFEGLFKEMNGYGVTIRYLDPPLHEFLPQDEKGEEEMAKRLNVSIENVKKKVKDLHELNPMLGHRGCRLSITYPEICVMQTTAVIEAACNMQKAGIKVLPEIMIPLVGKVEEFDYLAKIVRETADKVIAEKGVKLEYSVGTMLEIPRASFVADKISGGENGAEFFSFGTNDLTQMAFGYSRDDAGLFIADYIEKEILREDPFVSIDQEGVGALVEMGVKKGREGRANLKLGVCGEHGGDPASVKFFHRAGLDYVSCSPYRVPIARLAAAQAVIEERRKAK
jgi:pyruvate,orthophosphate dikinase